MPLYGSTRLACVNCLQRRLDRGISKIESERVRLTGRDALAAEHGVRHLAQHRLELFLGV